MLKTIVHVSRLKGNKMKSLKSEKLTIFLLYNFCMNIIWVLFISSILIPFSYAQNIQKELKVTVDDFIILKIANKLVYHYNDYPVRADIKSINLPEGWHSIEIEYKNKFGSNLLKLEEKLPQRKYFSLIPKNCFRYLDDSKLFYIIGLRADYYDLHENFIQTVLGEGPIYHAYSDYTPAIYQNKFGLWAKNFDGWASFEEKLRGEIYIGNTTPDLEKQAQNIPTLFLEPDSIFQEIENIINSNHFQDNLNLITFLNRVGIILESQGRYQETLTIYKKVLELYQKFFPINQHLQLANFFENIGRILEKLGNLEDSLIFYQKALENQKLSKNKHSLELANSFNNMGRISEKLKKWKDSLVYYQEAYKIAKLAKIENDLLFANFCINLGKTYENLGELEKALLFYCQSLEIRKTFYKNKLHPDLANSFEHIGNILYGLQEFAEAEKYLKEASTIQTYLYSNSYSHIAPYLASISYSYYFQSDYEESWKYNQKAWEMWKSLYEKKMISWPTSRKFFNAATHLQNQISMFLNLAEKNVKWHSAAYQHWAWRKGLVTRILANQKKKSEVAISERWKQYCFTREKLAQLIHQDLSQATTEKIYNDFQSLLDESENQEVELSKLLKEVDFFSEKSIGKIQKEIPDNAILLDYAIYFHLEKNTHYLGVFALTQDQIQFFPLETWENVKYKTQNILRKINEVPKKYEQAEQELKTELLQLTQMLLPSSLQESLQKKDLILICPDDFLHNFPFETLVIPETTGDLKYIIEKFNLVYLISSQDLLRKFSYSGKKFLGISNPKFADNIRHPKLMSKELDYTLKHYFRNTIILSDELATKSNFKQQLSTGDCFWLHVVTHGYFWQERPFMNLPHELLSDLNNEKISNPVLLQLVQENHLPWIEKREIKTVQKDREWHLYSNEKLQYIIAQEPKQKVLFLYPALSFKIPEYDPYIESSFNQIMQHNKFQSNISDNPLLLSAIILASSENKNEIFTAEEISFLPLDSVYCAIFACCETGTGLTINNKGESIFGFKWALNYSGAHYGIVSLWKISDEHTEDLITRFYSNCQEFPIWQALNLAKRDKINALRNTANHAHPYFWSGLICSGKPTLDIPEQLRQGIKRAQSNKEKKDIEVKEFFQPQRFAEIKILDDEHPSKIEITAKDNLYIYVGIQKTPNDEISWTQQQKINNKETCNLLLNSKESICLILSYKEVFPKDLNNKTTILRGTSYGLEESENDPEYAIWVLKNN